MTTPGSTSQLTPSFAAYVQARRPVLMRTARSLTADPNDAEDLLQTALAKTYLAWERIADHRAVDGYVRRTLINTRTSLWRKRRLDECAVPELPEPAAQSATDPGEQQALQHAVWQAVLRLPARQRAMVVLRYYEDLSEVHTAEVLEVSVGTVKSAVSRALSKLREDPELAGLIGQANGMPTPAAEKPTTVPSGARHGSAEADGATAGTARRRQRPASGEPTARTSAPAVTAKPAPAAAPTPLRVPEQAIRHPAPAMMAEASSHLVA